MFSPRKASAAGFSYPSWGNHDRRDDRTPRTPHSKIDTQPTYIIRRPQTASEQRIFGIGFAYFCTGQEAWGQWSDVRLVATRDACRRATLEACVRRELVDDAGVRPDMVPRLVAEFVDSFDRATMADWALLNFSSENVETFSQLSASMQGDLLKFADVACSDLHALGLCGVDLRGADLRCGRICEADWRDVDAGGICAADLHLSRASLNRVSFADADLNGARLDSLRCLNADFSRCDLTDAHLSLDVDWFTGGAGMPGHAVEARARFDALMREENGWCLLASLASIDDHYAELKRALMCQLIEVMETLSASESTVWNSISSWVSVLSDPVWWESPLISAFINEYLPVGIQASWNRLPVPADTPVERLRFHMEYLLQTAQHPQWAISHQGAIHQLALRARATGQLDALADTLFSRFLEHPGVAPVARALNDVLPETARDTCIFLSEDSLCAIACTQDLVRAVIDGKRDISWHNFYELQRAAADAPYAIVPCASPESTLRLIPLLHGRYQIDSGVEQRRFAGLLDAYWSTAPSSSVSASDAQEMSIAAERNLYRQCAVKVSSRVSTSRAEYKLITNSWQMRLQRLFGDAMVSAAGSGASPVVERASMRLTPAVKTALWHVCQSEMTGLADHRQHRAAFALVEAIRQTQLSSSLLLGTETASPVALRVLASAWLNEAHAEDPDLIPEDKRRRWKASLVGDVGGIGEMATCTATLADEMMSFVLAAPHRSALREIYDALLPHAWRR